MTLIFFVGCKASPSAPMKYKPFMYIMHTFFADAAEFENLKGKCWSKNVPKCLAISEYDFQKIDKNFFLRPYSHLYVSCDALSCTKRFLRCLQTCFVCITFQADTQKIIYESKTMPRCDQQKAFFDKPKQTLAILEYDSRKINKNVFLRHVATYTCRAML